MASFTTRHRAVALNVQPCLIDHVYTANHIKIRLEIKHQSIQEHALLAI